MKLRIVLSSVLILLLSLPVLAADDSMNAIKSRMKSRYPTLSTMKKNGMVGETHLGYVEATNGKYASDPKIKEVVKAENADRKSLYEIIGERMKAKPEAVGTQNALRIFDKAADNDWFKLADGKWKQKKKVEPKKTEKK